MSTLKTLPFAASIGSAKPTWVLPLFFGSTIFTSACLLFLVQPLISKMILPWFGGSAAVWITAMLFFQASLLLGYLYAHFLTTLLPSKMQVAIHVALLLTSIAVLPLAPALRWLPKPGEDPTAAVFAVLGTCVGLPYILLSATSPLIQKWFSLSGSDALPYRYFALSNAGSLLALFAFPLLVEPRFTGHQQSYLWSAGFLVFLVLCVSSAVLQLRNVASLSPAATELISRPTFGVLTLWTALAACASAMLLIVTNLLTQNIAPMPLLWVLPLGIYLLTFILCFDGSFWYRRWLFLPVVLPALAFIAATTHALEDAPFLRIVPLLTGALFIVCMACHGELARLKPQPAQLTGFYLSVAFGGALGGAAVAVLAPRFFNTTYEYPIVVTATAFVLLITLVYERATWSLPRFYLALWLSAAAACLVLGAFSAEQLRLSHKDARYMARNFYGPLRIDENVNPAHQRFLQLLHGTITHGTQFINSPLSRTPTTYYGRESGVGLSWRILESAGRPIKMGVIGLGTGTLAAYGRAGDIIRFYDINPLVIDIARTRFTYISDSPAHIDISLGDARLSLEQQNPQGYDLLVVDAFSGDAIPVHLLTEEAYRIYWRQLKPDGILAVHVSNRYLDLAPVVAGLVPGSGKQVRLIDNDDDDRLGVYEASYVLITSRPGFFTNPVIAKKAEPIKLKPGTRHWTDDYSNLWRALNFND